MLCSIGSVTGLALLMVGCRVGGGASSPPPPPPTNGYTVGGTVSGLVVSGLTLALCAPGVSGPHGTYIPGSCHSELRVGADGAFILDSAYSADYSGGDFVTIAQQPSSPAQYCALRNSKVSIQNTDDTGVKVCFTKFSYATNAADNTLSAYSVDANTGALTPMAGSPFPAGNHPKFIATF